MKAEDQHLEDVVGHGAAKRIGNFLHDRLSRAVGRRHVGNAVDGVRVVGVAPVALDRLRGDAGPDHVSVHEALGEALIVPVEQDAV